MVFYCCGSFYEIYCADDDLIDIKAISELLNIQVTRRNKAILNIDRNNFRMAGFPISALNILVDASYTIVIVDQITEAPHPKRAATDIISPGTKIDNITAPDSNMVLCAYVEEYDIWRKTNRSVPSQSLLAIGLSVIDITTGNSKNANIL